MFKNQVRAASAGIVAAVAFCAMSLAGLAATSTATAAPPITGCAIQTYTGNYLSAVDGGGRVTDVIDTDATQIRTWEKFTLVDTGDGHYGIQTYRGYYLTAQDSGGRTTDVIHSNAPWLLAWEKFTLHWLGGDVWAIQAFDGHYLTAVSGGGRTAEPTMYSNHALVGPYEMFSIGCGH